MGSSSLLSVLLFVWNGLFVFSGPSCTVIENMEWEYENLDIQLAGNSKRQGCREVADKNECCELCQTYWPQCLSWTFTKDGNDANGYRDMNNYCCLKPKYRAIHQSSLDPSNPNRCCDSGYFNPGCMITDACNIQIGGTGLASNDKMIIVSTSVQSPCANLTTADTTVPSWPGMTNPKGNLDHIHTVYPFGTPKSGVVGEYGMCYAQNSPSTIEGYVTTYGVFTMQGPEPNQAFDCTLGLPCWITIAGVGFPRAPARYKILLLPEETLCGSSSTISASFQSMQNPDNVEDDAYDNIFKTGTPMNGITDANYTLCWANDPTALSDYTARVGSFIMNGPTASPISCTMGLQCAPFITGMGLGSDNAVLVVVGSTITCGVIWATKADFGTTFVNPKRVSPAAFGAYDMGVALQSNSNTPGNPYKLCWSGAPSQNPPSYAVVDYNIQVGVFTINGPVFFDPSCIFTTMCILQLSGSGFAMSNGGLLIKKTSTCGDATPEKPDFAGNYWFNPVSANYSGAMLYEYGEPTAGTAGNSYWFCWSFRPGVDADYRVTVGTFTMGGPNNQVTQCTKGLTCTISIDGTSLDGTNHVLLLDEGEECGYSDKSPILSPMDVEKRTNLDGVSKTYSMGFGNQGKASINYTLCWAHNPVTRLSYTFEIGNFVLNGANDRATACTLSLPCFIQMAGVSLSSDNRIRIIKSGTCGQNGVPQPAFGGMVTSKLVTNQGPYYDTYSMSTPISGEPKTTYQLCWASAPGASGGDNLYRVFVGHFTMNGPDQNPTTCKVSVNCILQLTGVGLAASNKVVVLASSETCGDDGSHAISFGGFTNPQQQDGDNFGQYPMGIANSGVPGTGYRACWGHNPTWTGNMNAFNVDMGTFTLVAVDTINEVQCTLGYACNLQVTGTQMASSNAIVVIDQNETCGKGTNDRRQGITAVSFVGLTNPKVVSGGNAIYNLGVPTGGFPDTYKVCWAYDPSISGTLADYHLEVTFLKFRGPTPMPRTCTLSKTCAIALTGVDLSHSAKVLIVSYLNSCGDASPSVASWVGVTNPAPASLVGPANAIGYTFGQEDVYNAGIGSAGIPGALYRLCWSFQPTADGGFSDYKVTVGLFDMKGPTQGLVLACTLGQACNAQLSGYGLEATNHVLIVVNSAACGVSNPLIGNMQGIQNPKEVSNDDYDNQYALGLVTIGGSYSKCRVSNPSETCIGSHYFICWAYNPADVTEYTVQVGTFEMKGPFVTFATECTLGAFCFIRIYGTGFTAENRAMIAEGDCGATNPLVARFQGYANPQQASDLNNAGTEATFALGRASSGLEKAYKLCWGFNPLTIEQYNIEIGPFNFQIPEPGCRVRGGVEVVCDATT